jgi:hypothetical protein
MFLFFSKVKRQQSSYQYGGATQYPPGAQYNPQQPGQPINPNQPYNPNQQYPAGQQPYQPGQQQYVPGQNVPGPGQPGYNPNQYAQNQFPNSSQSVYDVYNQLYYSGGASQGVGGSLLSPLNVSPKMPIDEVCRMEFVFIINLFN